MSKILNKLRPMLLARLAVPVVLGIGFYFVEESFVPFYWLGSMIIMLLLIRSVLLNHW